MAVDNYEIEIKQTFGFDKYPLNELYIYRRLINYKVSIKKWFNNGNNSELKEIGTIKCFNNENNYELKEIGTMDIYEIIDNKWHSQRHYFANMIDDDFAHIDDLLLWKHKTMRNSLIYIKNFEIDESERDSYAYTSTLIFLEEYFNYTTRKNNTIVLKASPSLKEFYLLRGFKVLDKQMSDNGKDVFAYYMIKETK